MTEPVSRPLDSGGLDNVATVLIELHEQHPLADSDLIEMSGFYPSGSVRRLGYLLERVCDLPLDDLHDRAAPAGREPAPLDPNGPRRGHVDPRWNIRVNVDVEPDL